MKKILNDPRKLVNITFVALIISFIANIIIGTQRVSRDFIISFNFDIINLLFAILRNIYFGVIIAFIYFYKVKSKKSINLKVMNNLIFGNYIFATLFNLITISNRFNIKVIAIYIAISVFLGLIFYGNKTKLCKPNILYSLCIIVYIFNFLIQIISVLNEPYISNVKSYMITNNLLHILSTIYIIPMLSYFRLYGNNKIERGFKNGK